MDSPIKRVTDYVLNLIGQLSLAPATCQVTYNDPPNISIIISDLSAVGMKGSISLTGLEEPVMEAVEGLLLSLVDNPERSLNNRLSFTEESTLRAEQLLAFSTYNLSLPKIYEPSDQEKDRQIDIGMLYASMLGFMDGSGEHAELSAFLAQLISIHELSMDLATSKNCLDALQEIAVANKEALVSGYSVSNEFLEANLPDGFTTVYRELALLISAGLEAVRPFSGSK